MFSPINIKYFMVLYVGALLAWGAFQIGEPAYLWKGLAIAALYIIFDLLWTYFRDGTWYLPSSSVISGFIIAVVGAPAPSLDLLVLLPLVAVVSKQLITFWKPRHIFNPAAFSMAALTLAGYSAVSWWAPSLASDGVGIFIIIIAGLFILWRQRRWETALSFLASYGVFLAALFLWQGRGAGELFAVLKPQIFDGTTLFFASVMLIEPITSNFRGTKNRIIYGILVGAVAVLATAFGQYFFELDPLLSGLLIGNFIISIITI